MKKIVNLIKILTCGSVDDGKSTFIGRLLKDTGSILSDQKESLKNLSKKFGTQGKEIDYALLVDGLAAEREQGITIDVAYRYLNVGNTRYILADSPGHEQYTRNVITAASNCDLAIVLVDIKKGLSQQTFRHIRILSLIGIKHIIIALNKIEFVRQFHALGRRGHLNRCGIDIAVAVRSVGVGVGCAGGRDEHVHTRP